MENVTARAKPAPRVDHWPRSRLICIPGEPGPPVSHVHWWRRPSLSLHKTHMELHVPRLRSSMKPRRARAPPAVLPMVPSTSGLRAPIQGAGRRPLAERGVACTTAARGSRARGGLALRASRSAEAQARGLATLRTRPGCARRRRRPEASASSAPSVSFINPRARSFIARLRRCRGQPATRPAGAAGAPTQAARCPRLTLVPHWPGQPAFE